MVSPRTGSVDPHSQTTEAQDRFLTTALSWSLVGQTLGWVSWVLRVRAAGMWGRLSHGLFTQRVCSAYSLCPTEAFGGLTLQPYCSQPGLCPL